MLRACYEFSRVGFCRAPYVCYPLVFPDSGVLPVQRWRALVGMNQPSGLARAGVVINSFFWHNTAVCLMHCQKVVPAAFVCLAPGRLSDAIFGDRIQPGTVRLTREKRLCADRSTEQTLKKKDRLALLLHFGPGSRFALFGVAPVHPRPLCLSHANAERAHISNTSQLSDVLWFSLSLSSLSLSPLSLSLAVFRACSFCAWRARLARRALATVSLFSLSAFRRSFRALDFRQAR